MIASFLRSPLLRSTAVYTFSRVINSAIPFLLLPVMTRYLEPGDYGILTMFTLLVGVTTILVGVNLHGAVGVKYFDKDTDLDRYLGTCLVLILGASVVVLAAGRLFMKEISAWTAFPEPWLWMIPVVAVSQSVNLILLTVWQMENRPARFGAFQVLQTLVQFAIAVYLVVFAGKKWEGPVLALVLSTSAFALAGMFLMFSGRRIGFRFGKAEAAHALRFGLPLLPHALGGVLIIQIDRVFITNMVGIGDTGIYSVGFQMAYIVELIAFSFNQAYVPWLFAKLTENRPSEKELIVKYTYIYFGAILFLALAVSLVMPWFLGFFVGKKFAEASRYTFWIAVGFAFSGMYYMVTNYIFFSGRTHIVSWATLASLITNIALNFVLIRWNGAIGAAQASACSFFLLFVSTWYLSARVYKMPWNPRSSGR